MNKGISANDIAKMIDHSLLRPQLTEEEFQAGVQFSIDNQVATCSVVPNDVRRTFELLKGKGVPISTVVSFPHGNLPTDVKVFEAERAIDNGAVELDMVIAISRVIAEDFEYVEKDIKAVVEVAHAREVSVKVILENCYLTKEQIVSACGISECAGADFVKTSTGYGSGGATFEDVKLMRASCSPAVKIKAAGGIRTLDEVLKYRSLGVERIATRATEKILLEAKEREKSGNLRELP